jgi:hypothetical protein
LATNPAPFIVSVEANPPGGNVVGTKGWFRKGTGAPWLPPVPVSVAGIGATEDVKLTLTVAAKFPVAAGVKVTLMAQLAPAGTDAQVFVWEKFPGLAPWIVIAETCTAKDPTFDRLMICAALDVPIV